MSTRSPSPDLLQLGRGVIRWAPIVSGVRKPWLDMGNCESLTVGTADTKLTKNSSRVAATVVYKEITSERVVTLTIQGDEFNLDVLAAVLAGDIEEVAATAGGTITAEALGTPGELDVILKLAHPLVSSVVLKQGMTTFTAGDDYEVVDAQRGFVKLLADGDIDPDTAITADYTWDNAVAYKRIRGGTQNAVEASIYFAADNASGENRDLMAYRASLTSDGEQGFISNEFGTWTLKCKLLDDSAGLYGGSDASPLYEVFESPVAGA